MKLCFEVLITFSVTSLNLTESLINVTFTFILLKFVHELQYLWLLLLITLGSLLSHVLAFLLLLFVLVFYSFIYQIVVSLQFYPLQK